LLSPLALDNILVIELLKGDCDKVITASWFHKLNILSCLPYNIKLYLNLKRSSLVHIGKTLQSIAGIDENYCGKKHPITNNINTAIFCFLSPMLKDWWP